MHKKCTLSDPAFQVASTAASALSISTADSLTILAHRINAEHAQAEAALRDGLRHAVEAGRLLLEARAAVAHGEWLPWLESNFDGSARTARAYMLVATRLPRLEKQNGNAVANLSFRHALRLTAAPKATKEPATPGTFATWEPKVWPVETDYANFFEWYVAFMKAWWDEIERVRRGLREQGIADLKRRLASYKTVQQVMRDHDPAALIRARHQVEREECRWHHVADTVAKMASDRLAEVEAAEAEKAAAEEASQQ